MKCIFCKYMVTGSEEGSQFGFAYCAKGYWDGIEPDEYEHLEDNHLWDNCNEYEQIQLLHDRLTRPKT